MKNTLISYNLYENNTDKLIARGTLLLNLNSEYSLKKRYKKIMKKIVSFHSSSREINRKQIQIISTFS